MKGTMDASHKVSGPGKANKPSGPKPEPEGLTCNEGQIEDLFAEGESTEDEASEESLEQEEPTLESTPSPKR
jgi:hypothetical protein